jgi:hypothetical protein
MPALSDAVCDFAGSLHLQSGIGRHSQSSEKQGREKQNSIVPLVVPLTIEMSDVPPVPLDVVPSTICMPYFMRSLLYPLEGKLDTLEKAFEDSPHHTVMNGIGSCVISLVHSLSDFFISISVLIQVRLYSICHCYWIFATPEKRSATAL